MTTVRTLADMFIHEVTVETYKGAGPAGDVYVPTSEPVVGFVAEKIRQVRNTAGDLVVSSATVIIGPDQATIFTPGSRVHLPSGRRTRVLAHLTHDAGNLGAWSHGEVVCE